MTQPLGRENGGPQTPANPGAAPVKPASPGARPLKRRHAIAVLPALFTLGNGLCGFASMHYAALGDLGPVEGHAPAISNFAIAGYLIFAAMLFDVFDGFIARLARATTNFGAELDSLADMVSFGVAPAFLTLELVGELLNPDSPTRLTPFYPTFLGANTENLFCLIGGIYVCCTALRLARFNVVTQHAVDSHLAFRGLPGPGAAGVVASTIIFFEALQPSRHFLWQNSIPGSGPLLRAFPYVLPVLLFAAALLMVSRFQYAHLINRFLRGRRRFNYVVGLVVVLLLGLWQPQITALLAIYVYALSAPVGWLWRRIFRVPPAPAATPAITMAKPPTPPSSTAS